MDELGPILLAALLPPLWAFGMRKLARDRNRTLHEGWILASAGIVIADCMDGILLALVVAVANLLVGVVMWWLSRRRRKRAPKAYGAKSRARLAALVRKSREATKPRPVLQPVPGGAR